MAVLFSNLSLVLVFVAAVQAQIVAYGQCGGAGWCYNTNCQPGYICTFGNSYYSQCIPAAVPVGYLGPYVQCGGSITTPCCPGYGCVTSNGYSMCSPINYPSLTTVNTCLMSATSSSSTKPVGTSSVPSLKLSSSSTKSSSALSSSSSKVSSSSSSTKTSSSIVATTSSSSSKVNIVSSSYVKLLSSSSKVNVVSSSYLKHSSSTVVTTSKSSSRVTSSSSAVLSSTSTVAGPPAQQTPYGQCGGIGWSGPTACTSGWTCIPQAGNPWYSQCLPGTNSPPPSVQTSTFSSSSQSFTTKVSTKSSTTSIAPIQTAPAGTCKPSPGNCGITSSPPACAGSVKFAGINIAGCDFGTDTNGNQSPSGAYCPIGQYNPDGPGQMTHFASEKFNIFRLPTGWQYIVNSNSPSATLDPTNWGNYKNLVQACLNTGAYCLIDIHNYARFNGAVIGQGGPSNALFAQLWANIAAVYASNPKIIFGIMNEPHDINIGPWAQTVQVVVTAIRNAGATSQIILLPGNDWTGAGTFVSDGSGPALAAVVNPDGTTTNLVFDVHKYLDQDGSGTNTICVGDQVSTAFAPLAQWLRCNGRQALLSETGGSSDSSCLTYMCSAIKFLNANSDVYLGYIGWAAGSFSPGYTLAMTPTNNNGVWTDTTIVSQCFVPH